MKKTASLLFLIILFTGCDTLNKTAQILNQQVGSTPSASEIALGLKQALETGTNKSSQELSAQNGFFGNAVIKILFPPEAKKVENTLRSLGFNQLCDNVILSLNRAAENAAAEAKPIFISAIKQMTINDAANILLSDNNNAATEYFERVTTDQLRAKFKPVITSSLSKVGATKYWSDLITQYNKIPLVSKINPDLNDYVTQKAIDGLFYEISQEEIKIRNNINARPTLLLQKVFGYADRNKK